MNTSNVDQRRLCWRVCVNCYNLRARFHSTLYTRRYVVSRKLKTPAANRRLVERYNDLTDMITSKYSTISVTCQSHLVKISVNRGSRIGGGKRGRVYGFSAASRKRLLEMFARLDISKLSTVPVMITLTYPAQFPSNEVAKQHFEAFRQRLKRFAAEVPGFAAIWRMEFQKRGAPHFHIICFELPFLKYEYLARWWSEIIGAEARTRIEALKDWRKAFGYASKYVAKMADTQRFRCSTCNTVHDGFVEVDRRVSKRGNEIVTVACPVCGNVTSRLAASCGLVHDTYLDAENWTGRLWGVINKESLPFGEEFQTRVSAPISVMHQFRRLMARKWRGLRRGLTYSGGTVFVGAAEQWYDAFLDCLLSG